MEHLWSRADANGGKRWQVRRQRKRLSERFEVPSTTQLFGTEALGHPALHLCDVTKLRSLDEDALDAQVSESLGHFRTSHRVRWWSGHTERLSPPNPATHH